MANTAQIVAQELTSAGATRAGAAGVIGNWQQESGLNAASNGGLLGQWQGPRYAALQSFAQQQGKPVTDPAVQARFAVNEMKSQYGGLWHMLTTTNDPRAAAVAVSQQYERPGIPMLGNRIRYATAAFQQLGGLQPSSIARQMSQSVSSTAPTSSTDFGSALADTLMSESASPVNTSGKVSVPNTLGTAANAVASGAYTTSTPAQTSISSAASQGAAQQSLTAKAVNDAAAGGANADAQKLLGMLHQVIGGAYNQGNHADVGETAAQVKAKGTDCSGLVSWLMGPGGLGIWNTSLATPNIATAPGIQAGKGASVTIWNNKQAGNAGHVFVQIGNQFFASEGGVGIKQISTSEAQNYIAHGSDGGTYEALHPKGL